MTRERTARWRRRSDDEWGTLRSSPQVQNGFQLIHPVPKKTFGFSSTKLAGKTGRIVRRRVTVKPTIGYQKLRTVLRKSRRAPYQEKLLQVRIGVVWGEAILLIAPLESCYDKRCWRDEGKRDILLFIYCSHWIISS